MVVLLSSGVICYAAIVTGMRLEHKNIGQLKEIVDAENWVTEATNLPFLYEQGL